jgi:hypothetical protein
VEPKEPPELRDLKVQPESRVFKEFKVRKEFKE